ncbi:hypothetical protein [Campylobacter sp. JMF_08 NE1]|uniref:hypothetical protein n=1 Tax=Campylobacter sp. JMF_08 NE1 TaxID=2983821 RepID=UPI0022E9BBD8|nr:hypothetical protein [Campylobacter sp. JMF_08 NE1]MDA3047300.1 hypothetical protein [Campylobacter sp. JMF_08 NE1]
MKRKYRSDDEWRAKRVWTKLDKIQKTNHIKYTPKTAKANANCQPRQSQNFWHDTREEEEKLKAKSIKDIYSDLNEYSCSAEQMQKREDEIMAQTIQNYYERTKQRIQAKNYKQSMVITLNAEHTLVDVERVADKVCKEFGWQYIGSAVHRDEGHFYTDENGKKCFDPNLHAHIEFITLNEKGIQCFRARQKRDIGKRLQTIVADELGMERGFDYSANGEKAPKGLSSQQYAMKMKDLQKATEEKDLTIKELNETIKDLRGQLQENHATRADYAKLEQEAKKLREAIKNKELISKAEFEKQITLIQEQMNAKFRAEKEQSDKEKTEKDEKIKALQIENEKLNERKGFNDYEYEQLSNLEKKALKYNNQELKAKHTKKGFLSFSKEVTDYKALAQELGERNETLQEIIKKKNLNDDFIATKKVKEKNSELWSKNFKLESENRELNAQISTLKEKIAKDTTQSVKTQENAKETQIDSEISVASVMEQQKKVLLSSKFSKNRIPKKDKGFDYE